jgi:hypothetical protein
MPSPCPRLSSARMRLVRSTEDNQNPSQHFSPCPARAASLNWLVARCPCRAVISMLRRSCAEVQPSNPQPPTAVVRSTQLGQLGSRRKLERRAGIQPGEYFRAAASASTVRRCVRATARTELLAYKQRSPSLRPRGAVDVELPTEYDEGPTNTTATEGVVGKHRSEPITRPQFCCVVQL